MLAPALADVLVRDPEPAEAAGLGDHPLERLPVSLLRVGATRQLGLSLAKPYRERVANPLEIGDAEDPRAPGRRDRIADSPARERGREELRELMLESADLAPQVGAHPPLVIARRRPRGQCGRNRAPWRCRLQKQLGHDEDVTAGSSPFKPTA